MPYAKLTYTVYFRDGSTRDVETSRGLAGARSKVSEHEREEHGGLIGIIRAGEGYAVVKIAEVGLTAADEAMLAGLGGGSEHYSPADLESDSFGPGTTEE